MNLDEEKLANGLGWFSLGLGLAELLAPDHVGKAVGLRNHRNLLRAAGLREIAAGVGILTQPRAPGWVWSRVAGDVMDLGLLGSALASSEERSPERRRAIGALIAVAGVTALDVYCGAQLSRRNGHHLRRNGADRDASGSFHGRPVRKSITINRPAEEIFQFWRNFENLPQFMNHLKSVTVESDTRSHWVAKGPAGSEVSWDAVIIEEKPNELISWRSLPGSTVDNAGSVRFEPAIGGRGTVVRVNLRYRPPAGAVGATIAKLFGEAPEKQIPVDLLRIKQLLETGEIARTEGQPAGRAHSTSRKFDDFIRT